MGPSSVSAHGLEGVVAAVLVIVGTIFLGRRASTGRRRVPRRSLDLREPDLGNPSLNGEESSNLDREETDRSREETDRNLEETEQSHSRVDVCVPDIFLSHSGHQNSFVESVYKALQGANHTAFFDQHTLPKGRPFPDEIKEAARGCKLGVVVLSEEFLTSKWPMLELEMLISQRGPDPHVLPLFYQLNPADLKSQEKLQKWRHLWKKMAGGKDGAKKWEQAVKALRRFSNEVYTRGTSTDAYIDRVVKHIGALIPCHVPYDCSSIQGQSRLVQEIATKFDHVDESRACILVGLHGVAGLGKTTVCKMMVNYYSTHYLGRSFLIEFPSRGGDKSMITSECKKALKILTDASEVHLLDKVDQFDQVVQLMRDRVGRHDVFLAIDNLWESSLDEAKRVLQAGFSANSKILVTSRSEGLLEELLMVTCRSLACKASVAPLPAPEREEAFQIFQESFGLCDLRNLEDTKEMNNIVLESCMFRDSYHALALKALAKYVRRLWMDMYLKEDEHGLSSMLKEISNEKLEEVEDVIRLSYDFLSEQKKHLFLDIVVFIKWYDGIMYADVEEWISTLYGFSKLKIRRLVDELCLDGLIQLEVDEFGRKVIGFHDLYSELALREIANSPSYVIQDSMDSMEISVEKVDWQKLETVILYSDESRFFEKLQQCKCPKLKLFKVRGIVMESSKVRLNFMPSLTVLELSRIKLVENEDGCDTPDSEDEDGSAALDFEKKNVVRSNTLKLLEQATGMPSVDHKAPVKSPDQEGSMKSPRRGFVKGESVAVAPGILRLNRFDKLRKLKVESCDFVEIAVLRSLVQLRVLSIESCWKLQKLPDVSSLTCLESLCLADNAALEEVGALSCTLKDVSVTKCMALKRMPDMSSLTCLERLGLVANAALEEVGGLSCTLKDVSVTKCRALRRVPDMSSLTCLERLGLVDNAALEEVGALSCAVKDVSVTKCRALKRMPDMSSLTSLERLGLVDNAALEEVGALSCAVKDVSVTKCRALKRMPDMSSLTCLERLGLVDNAALEEVGALSCTLKDVSVTKCRALKRVPDMSSLTCLERLGLSDNAALEEVGGECLSSTLKGLHILDSRMLKSFPSVYGCMHLERLEVGWADCLRWLWNVPNLRQVCLRRFCVWYDSSMKEIDVGCFSNLEYLEIKRCEALEQIRGVVGLLSLKELVIGNCPRLKKLSVRGPSLKRVEVEYCEALQEIRGDLEALPSLVIKRL